MEKFLMVFIVIAVIGLTTFLFLDFQGMFGSSSQEEDVLIEPSPQEIETSEQNEPLLKEEVVEIEEPEEETEEPLPPAEEPEEKVVPDDEFIQCLVDSGMVVYASKTCPACTNLADLFGGYESVEDLFVICSEERERCDLEMKRNAVPEIQINGELLEGARSLENFAQKTGCIY